MPVPLTPDQIIKGSEAAISAGTFVAKLAANRHKDQRLKANQVIGQLALDALKLSEQHLGELRAIKQKLKKAGVLGMTADKIVGDVRWWRLRQYLAVRTYDHQIAGIVDSLGDLQQEMIAIAHCIEAESWVAESASDALAASRQRRKLLDSNQPIGKVLDQLIEDAEDLIDSLNRTTRKPK